MQKEAVDRVRLVFTLFDTDDNGHLDAGDFDRMAARVVAAAPESGEAAKDAMRSAFRQYWTTLAAELDTNRDGKVTFDEYTAIVLSPERFDETVGAFAESLAALGDPDGDGLIERPVFMALMTAIGFERANIDALFDAFEPSASDQITVPTWVTGIKDYYSPAKAGIAGDQLVGGRATA
jgi:Ca2+-binding EF-hand superfamily protein